MDAEVQNSCLGLEPYLWSYLAWLPSTVRQPTQYILNLLCTNLTKLGENIVSYSKQTQSTHIWPHSSDAIRSKPNRPTVRSKTIPKELFQFQLCSSTANLQYRTVGKRGRRKILSTLFLFIARYTEQRLCQVANNINTLILLVECITWKLN